MSDEIIEVTLCPKCNETIRIKKENVKNGAFLCKKCLIAFPLKINLSEMREINKEFTKSNNWYFQLLWNFLGTFLFYVFAGVFFLAMFGSDGCQNIQESIKSTFEKKAK